jgi:peptidoglycan hydrolase-like protein with peptidoglycan-binding domain
VFSPSRDRRQPSRRRTPHLIALGAIGVAGAAPLLSATPALADATIEVDITVEAGQAAHVTLPGSGSYGVYSWPNCGKASWAGTAYTFDTTDITSGGPACGPGQTSNPLLDLETGDSINVNITVIPATTPPVPSTPTPPMPTSTPTPVPPTPTPTPTSAPPTPTPPGTPTPARPSSPPKRPSPLPSRVPAPPVTALPATQQQGSRGFDVARIQRLLRIPADGIFGPQTAAAVRAFQAAHHLLVDGIVGRQTWTALLAGGTSATTPVARPWLRIGSTGSYVREAQQLLAVRVDGVFGAQTRAAVVAFQRRHQLQIDGVVGSQTWAALPAR